jgi:hypothetical protein
MNIFCVKNSLNFLFYHWIAFHLNLFGRCERIHSMLLWCDELKINDFLMINLSYIWRVSPIQKLIFHWSNRYSNLWFFHLFLSIFSIPFHAWNSSSWKQFYCIADAKKNMKNWKWKKVLHHDFACWDVLLTFSIISLAHVLNKTKLINKQFLISSNESFSVGNNIIRNRKS